FPEMLSPPLSDLARLEWARVEAFDAADAIPLTRDDLRALAPEDWPSLSLALVPSAKILDAGILVWRRGFVVRHRAIEGEERAAIARLPATFAEMCDVEGDPETIARRVLAMLEQWIVDELVSQGT